jgi:hypothetical protein
MRSPTQQRRHVRESAPAFGAGLTAVFTVAATDALFALNAAVGLQACDSRVCDASGDGNLSAVDALMILQSAVGGSVDLMCPA